MRKGKKKRELHVTSPPGRGFKSRLRIVTISDFPGTSGTPDTAIPSSSPPRRTRSRRRCCISGSANMRLECVYRSSRRVLSSRDHTLPSLFWFFNLENKRRTLKQQLQTGREWALEMITNLFVGFSFFSLRFLGSRAPANPASTAIFFLDI